MPPNVRPAIPGRLSTNAYASSHWFIKNQNKSASFISLHTVFQCPNKYPSVFNDFWWRFLSMAMIVSLWKVPTCPVNNGLPSILKGINSRIHFIFLTVHPDLQTEQAVHNDNSITLLGYILDPYEPSLSNSDIINRIIRQVSSADDVFSHLDSVCGRYVLVLSYDNNLRIFSDTAGLRQVFYTKDSSNAVWCAAQPGIIAEQLNMEFDKEILNNFIKHIFYF